MDDQYLYRYFDQSGASLYNGRSNDWTRRLREHWRDDYWSSDIMGVRVERYPNLGSVVAAEAASIRAERPRYNVQHNLPGTSAGDFVGRREWAAEDVILMIGLAVVVAYVVYKGTVIGIEKYRRWKAERENFRAWKQAHAAEVAADERVATPDGPAMSMAPASVIVTEPIVVPFVATEEPKTVIVPEPTPALTPMPTMNPLVAVALAIMLPSQPHTGGWKSPPWPPTPAPSPE